MSKIEPMSVEEMRYALRLINWDFVGPDFEGGESCNIARFILAWICAEARARSWEHSWRQEAGFHICDRCQWIQIEDWIAAVKKEVGWGDGD